MKEKNSYQAFMEKLNTLETNNLFKEPQECLAENLLQKLLEQIISRTGGDLIIGSNEFDLYDSLTQAEHFLSEAQENNQNLDLNKIAVPFFQLGARLGRLQALEYFAPSIINKAEEDASRSNGGRRATAKREGITFIAFKVLERYLKENPEAINLKGKCLIRGVKTKLKNQLVELFDFNTKRGMNNCQVCGLYDSLSDRTAKDKIKHVVDIYFNTQFVEIEPELMNKLILW